MEVQTYLIAGLEQILSVTDSQFEEHAVDAFCAFRKGVVHANNVEDGDELLASLGTKVYHYQFVLKFLIRVYDEKPAYRNQVIAVLQVLLHVDAWLKALQVNSELLRQLPAEVGADELIASAEEEVAHKKPEESGSTVDEPAGGASPFATTILADNPSLTLTLAYLEQGAKEIAALGFSVDTSHDKAIQAFNAFQQGITRATLSKTDADEKALNALEPKTEYMRFLADVYISKSLYRSRAKSAMRKLLCQPFWSSAAAAHSELANILFDMGLTCEGSDVEIPAPPPEPAAPENPDVLKTIPLHNSESLHKKEGYPNDESPKQQENTESKPVDSKSVPVASQAAMSSLPQAARRRSTLQSIGDALSSKFGKRDSAARRRSSTGFSSLLGAGAMFGDMLKEGSLEKQSPSVFHSWQKRTFRLYELAIIYSSSEDWQPQGKQCIPLSVVQAVHREGLTFEIVTTTRGERKPYQCRAATEKEAQEWVDAISAAVENQVNKPKVASAGTNSAEMESPEAAS